MEVGYGALLFLGVLRSRLRGVEEQRKNAVQIAGPLIHGGDVAIHGELAGTESNRRLRSGQQQIRQTGNRLLLRVGHSLAVVEGEVITRRLGIIVDIFQQPRADVEFCLLYTSPSPRD